MFYELIIFWIVNERNVVWKDDNHLKGLDKCVDVGCIMQICIHSHKKEAENWSYYTYNKSYSLMWIW